MSNSTIRNIIIAISITIFSLCVFGLITYQIIAQGDRLASQISTLEDERAQETSFLRLQKLSLETVEKRNELKNYFLLKEGDSIDFLNKIETLALSSGIQLKTQNLEELTEKSDKSTWIQVTFTINSSREKVQQFIQVIETLPYVLKIESVAMSARSSTDWGADIRLKVRILEYDE